MLLYGLLSLAWLVLLSIVFIALVSESVLILVCIRYFRLFYLPLRFAGILLLVHFSLNLFLYFVLRHVPQVHWISSSSSIRIGVRIFSASAIIVSIYINHICAWVASGRHNLLFLYYIILLSWNHFFGLVLNESTFLYGHSWFIWFKWFLVFITVIVVGDRLTIFKQLSVDPNGELF